MPLSLTYLPVYIPFILFSRIMFSFFITFYLSLKSRKCGVSRRLVAIWFGFWQDKLTLVVEISSSILILAQLLFHFYVVALNNAFLLLDFVLPINLFEPDLVRLVIPSDQKA